MGGLETNFENTRPRLHHLEIKTKNHLREVKNSLKTNF